MKFNDCGIVISVAKYSENSAIIKVFSKEHGVYRGFVKNITSKKNRAIFQVGNLISFEWRSRIEEALGAFYYCDLEKTYASKVMFEKLQLNCLISIFSILDSCFFERENQQELYQQIINFLDEITCDDAKKMQFLMSYIKLELEILKVLGYAIDITSCAVSNVTQNLIYVSPKSARAVCKDVGLPYESKLLSLPQFLLGQSQFSESELESEVRNGLKLSGYFLEKFVFSHNNYRSSSRNLIEKFI